MLARSRMSTRFQPVRAVAHGGAGAGVAEGPEDAMLAVTEARSPSVPTPSEHATRPRAPTSWSPRMTLRSYVSSREGDRVARGHRHHRIVIGRLVLSSRDANVDPARGRRARLLWPGPGRPGTAGAGQ